VVGRQEGFVLVLVIVLMRNKTGHIMHTLLLMRYYVELDEVYREISVSLKAMEEAVQKGDNDAILSLSAKTGSHPITLLHTTITITTNNTHIHQYHSDKHEHIHYRHCTCENRRTEARN
jgi:hypothetical protein